MQKKNSREVPLEHAVQS